MVGDGLVATHLAGVMTEEIFSQGIVEEDRAHPMVEGPMIILVRIGDAPSNFLSIWFGENWMNIC